MASDSLNGANTRPTNIHSAVRTSVTPLNWSSAPWCEAVLITIRMTNPAAISDSRPITTDSSSVRTQRSLWPVRSRQRLCRTASDACEVIGSPTYRRAAADAALAASNSEPAFHSGHSSLSAMSRPTRYSRSTSVAAASITHSGVHSSDGL